MQYPEFSLQELNKTQPLPSPPRPQRALKHSSELLRPPKYSQDPLDTNVEDDEDLAIERLRRFLRFCLLVDYRLESRDTLAPAEYSFWLHVRRVAVELTKTPEWACAVPEELQRREYFESVVSRPAEAIGVPLSVVCQMLRHFWLGINWMGRHKSLMYNFPYRGLNVLATKLLIDKEIFVRVFNRREDWRAVQMLQEEHQALVQLWFKSIGGPDTFELTEYAKEFEARCTMAKTWAKDLNPTWMAQKNSTVAAAGRDLWFAFGRFCQAIFAIERRRSTGALYRTPRRMARCAHPGSYTGARRPKRNVACE